MSPLVSLLLSVIWCRLNMMTMWGFGHQECRHVWREVSCKSMLAITWYGERERECVCVCDCVYVCGEGNMCHGLSITVYCMA